MDFRIVQARPWLDERDAAAVGAAVADGWITEGPRSRAFAERLNRLIDVPYGVFAPNGTLALALGLMALGVGPGDEVLVPDITFFGSASAVILTGATPVLVDVEPVSFQIDLARAREQVTPSTRAIMPVHLFGTACDMDAVNRFAQAFGLRVIEDAAQGIGVSHRDRPVGGLGDVGCFSFFADKTITTGEGGYITCRDPAIHERLGLLRNQGRIDRGSFIHQAVGYNFRLTDMQAALGLSQLDRLAEIIAHKQALWARYRDGLAALPEVRVLGAAADATLVPFRCVLMAEDAHGLMAHLEADGIQPRTSFYPLHRQPALRAWGAGRIAPAQLDDATFPAACRSWDGGVCLPIFPTLDRDAVATICTSIKTFYRKRRTAG